MSDHPREPLGPNEVQRRLTMSIEKESTGLPEVNVHRRTTKVNLSIIIGIGIFFAAMAALVFYLSARHG